MNKRFTKEECKILKGVARELDEFYVDERKCVMRTKYVFEVPPLLTYDDWDKNLIGLPVPENLVGTWMMQFQYDLSDDTLNYCIKEYTWVRCKQVEKVITVWEVE